jgi:hypothetical protein
MHGGEACVMTTVLCNRAGNVWRVSTVPGPSAAPGQIERAGPVVSASQVSSSVRAISIAAS